MFIRPVTVLVIAIAGIKLPLRSGVEALPCLVGVEVAVRMVFVAAAVQVAVFSRVLLAVVLAFVAVSRLMVRLELTVVLRQRCWLGSVGSRRDPREELLRILMGQQQSLSVCTRGLMMSS